MLRLLLQPPCSLIYVCISAFPRFSLNGSDLFYILHFILPLLIPCFAISFSFFSFSSFYYYFSFFNWRVLWFQYSFRVTKLWWKNIGMKLRQDHCQIVRKWKYFAWSWLNFKSVNFGKYARYLNYKMLTLSYIFFGRKGLPLFRYFGCILRE